MRNYSYRSQAWKCDVMSIQRITKWNRLAWSVKEPLTLCLKNKVIPWIYGSWKFRFKFKQWRFEEIRRTSIKIERWKTIQKSKKEFKKKVEKINVEVKKEHRYLELR